MNIKNYWSEKESVEYFDNKKNNNFFLTETHLFEKINNKFKSVLDLGCATGNLIKLLNNYTKNLSYFGIDIVYKQIELAKKKYPNQKFIHEDFMSYSFLEKFDLVNATGLLQHSINYYEILKKMILVSNKFITFDIKIAQIDQDLISIQDSFIKVKDNKITYIIFSLSSFHNKLLELYNIKNIYYYGYLTNINENAHIPKLVKKVYSVGYLIEKNIQDNHLETKIIGKIDDYI